VIARVKVGCCRDCATPDLAVSAAHLHKKRQAPGARNLDTRSKAL
jgi:hypothetical protein